MNIFERAIQKTEQFLGGLTAPNPQTGSSPLGGVLSLLPIAIQFLTIYETAFPGHPGNVAAAVGAIGKLSTTASDVQSMLPALEASLSTVLTQVQQTTAAAATVAQAAGAAVPKTAG